MILPTTSLAALLLLILSTVCLGSWANAQKLVGKWRFELFYYDYMLGVVMCAVVAAYTLGEADPQDLTFADNLLLIGYHQMAYGIASGVVLSLANILLVAAIAVSGLAVAFPIALGLAMVIGVVRTYASNPQGNAILLFGGAVLVVIAIMVDAFAYSGYLDAQLAASNEGPRIDPRTKRAVKPVTAVRGIALSLLSGILMALFYPLVELERIGDNAVAPYGMALLFAGGLLLTTFLYVPFFANFPVMGEPIQLRNYFRGTKKQHFWGIFGGIVWAAGAIAGLVAASAPPGVQAGPAISYGLGQGAALLSALWGLIVWREFKGGDVRTQMLLVTMIVLFVTGVSLVSIAPLYVSK